MADFGVNASGAPAFVFQPVTGSVNATLKVTNIGSSPLFVGPLATLSTPGAFPVPVQPGRALYVNPVTAATYLSAGYKGAAVTTLSAVNSTAGSSSFTVASNASFPAGTLMLLGSVTSSQELLVVASTTSTTVITTTNPSLYDHVASSTVSTATAIPGQARVLTGVI